MGEEIMETKNGFIIYLDLLGYKNLLHSNNKEHVQQLESFIEGFNKDYVKSLVAEHYDRIFDEKRLLFRCYSDNFLIFYESQNLNKGLLGLCIFLTSDFLGSAICKGFMFRASIVYGELSYNDEVIFGSSIVEAYELESGHLEPSIVLSKELKEVYERDKMYEDEIMSPFAQYYPSDRKSANDYYQGIEILIDRLNRQSFVDERTIAKYRWLINEYNRYFDGYYKIIFTEEPGHYRIELKRIRKTSK